MNIEPNPDTFTSQDLRKQAFAAKVAGLLVDAEAAYDNTDPDSYQTRIDGRERLYELGQARALGSVGRYNEAIALTGVDGLEPAVFGFDSRAALFPGFPEQDVAADIESRRTVRIQKVANAIQAFEARRAHEDALLSDPGCPQSRKDEILYDRNLEDQLADHELEMVEAGLRPPEHFFIGIVREATRLQLVLEDAPDPDCCTLVCLESRFGKVWSEDGNDEQNYTESTPLGQFASATEAINCAYDIAPSIAAIAGHAGYGKGFRESVDRGMAKTKNFSKVNAVAIHEIARSLTRDAAYQEWMNKEPREHLPPPLMLADLTNTQGEMTYIVPHITNGHNCTVDTEEIGAGGICAAAVDGRHASMMLFYRYSAKDKKVAVEQISCDHPSEETKEDIATLAQWLAGCENVNSISVPPEIFIDGHDPFTDAMLACGKGELTLPEFLRTTPETTDEIIHQLEDLAPPGQPQTHGFDR